MLEGGRWELHPGQDSDELLSLHEEHGLPAALTKLDFALEFIDSRSKSSGGLQDEEEEEEEVTA